ncbi:AraC family transcriptional regulator [Paenibacillus sp. WQ 127069]|uniref:AraC family transcriptional regulator n=1 Tax=Paenibacillus baimaensis TaxID=2982185 RepID=A0ABT2UUC7_9BACL|nr:AraC family transcriptional regulator [Paenibacillus sp. WQ 127069]MCU6797621.1 AraC family transcriptional regulator [Paenibacillus sp. WQ 127069]
MNNQPRYPAPYSIYFLHSIHKRRYCKEPLRYRHFPVTMICFIIKGTGTLLIDSKLIEIKPLQLYIFKPNMDIEIALQSESIEYYTVMFRHFTSAAVGKNHQSIQLLRAPLPAFPAGYIPMEDPANVQALLRSLYEKRNEPADPFQSHIQFQELLQQILQAPVHDSVKPLIRHSIQQITAYMQSNFAGKLDMVKLAAMAGMTTSSFSRLFKKTIGVSPIEYLTQLRMESAKHLLSKPGYKIKHVSAAVGYENEFYFSRMFQQKVGVSPTFFMTRYRLKIAVVSCLKFQDSLRSLGIEPIVHVNCFKYPGMGDSEHAHVLSCRLQELEHAQPDVIIADMFHQEFQEELIRITPTVMFAVDPDWSVNYRNIAELLGREEKAEQELNQLALHTTAARRLLARSMVNQTVTLMQVNHLFVRIQGTIDHPLNELIYQELGLKPGSNMPLQTKSIELAPQWLPPLETDHLFIQKNHLRAGSENMYEQMCGTHAWKAIKAVQQGNVMLIPNWFSMSWTSGGRRAIIDQLVEYQKNTK